MKLPMYTLYDTVTEKYSNPFIAENDASAMRQIYDSMNHPSAIAAAYKDCILVKIAIFDYEYGKLESLLNEKSGVIETVKLDFIERVCCCSDLHDRSAFGGYVSPNHPDNKKE